jgi:hypothetical protein
MVKSWIKVKWHVKILNRIYFGIESKLLMIMPSFTKTDLIDKESYYFK